MSFNDGQLLEINLDAGLLLESITRLLGKWRSEYF